ncbi:unnamed protein product, partial [Iphiclides podalirius]
MCLGIPAARDVGVIREIMASNRSRRVPDAFAHLPTHVPPPPAQAHPSLCHKSTANNSIQSAKSYTSFAKKVVSEAALGANSTCVTQKRRRVTEAGAGVRRCRVTLTPSTLVGLQRVGRSRGRLDRSHLREFVRDARFLLVTKRRFGPSGSRFDRVRRHAGVGARAHCQCDNAISGKGRTPDHRAHGYWKGHQNQELSNKSVVKKSR